MYMYTVAELWVVHTDGTYITRKREGRRCTTEKRKRQASCTTRPAKRGQKRQRWKKKRGNGCRCTESLDVRVAHEGERATGAAACATRCAANRFCEVTLREILGATQNCIKRTQRFTTGCKKSSANFGWHFSDGCKSGCKRWSGGGKTAVTGVCVSPRASSLD